MMRERTRIESAMNDIRMLEREADDAELWDMAQAEGDKGALAEVEASIRAAVGKAKSAELKALLSGEVDANDCYIESQRWRGRHGEPGLGLDAAPHVCALRQRSRHGRSKRSTSTPAIRRASSQRPC
jgi:hypothetical protein